ncbi:MAG TPA: hypothetical protein VL200_06715 [Lacunisphaera sp.]|nr:hypothetical protein [Lacunisphaera sp.]
MALPRLFTHRLLGPGDVGPSQDNLKPAGVFNPAVALFEGATVLLARVAEVPVEERPGWIALPRWEFPARRLIFDWVREEVVERLDTRSVRFRADGHLRLTFVSHLCLFHSRDGRVVDRMDPTRFLPQNDLEEYGVEDPRITRIGDVFYITYVAVSRHGAATALASTPDFRTFTRHGLILCPDNKDVVLFPERIDGRYTALHRPSLSSALTRPEMWLATSPDLLDWGSPVPLRRPRLEWERERLGAGAPPVRTSVGWLEFYHGNDRRLDLADPGRYAGGLLLLDFANPAKVLGVSSDAVFVPELDFERNGFVPNVVFPTGLELADDLALLYYGAGDAYSAVVGFRLADLLGAVGR